MRAFEFNRKRIDLKLEVRMTRNLFAVLCILAVVGLGCAKLKELGKGGESAAYKSDKDGFSIQFPSGPEVKEESADVKWSSSARTYGKSFENRSDNYRSYEVTAAEPLTSVDGKTDKEIEEIGLNGWEDEPETVVKDITVDGIKALDSVRSVEIGPAKMTFREVPIWSAKNKKLYVIQVAAVKKENVSTKEANDFINSFKILNK